MCALGQTLSSQAFPFPRRSAFLSFIHIYCDESGKHKQQGVTSFAALCVRIEALTDFDSRWNGLLRQYSLDELHMVKVSRLSQKFGSRFKAKQSYGERVELLKPFADCITDLMETGMVSIWDTEGFESIPDKQRKALADVRNPYHLAFISGLQMIARYGHADDKIIMVCDDDEQTAWDCYAMYRGLRKSSLHVQKKLKSLSFADSATFPALQAADMIAYLSRQSGEERWNKRLFHFRDLLAYATQKQRPGKMDWKIAYADKESLEKSKNWRVK